MKGKNKRPDRAWYILANATQKDGQVIEKGSVVMYDAHEVGDVSLIEAYTTRERFATEAEAKAKAGKIAAAKQAEKK